MVTSSTMQQVGRVKGDIATRQGEEKVGMVKTPPAAARILRSVAPTARANMAREASSVNIME
jgi:hypothetical protein